MIWGLIAGVVLGLAGTLLGTHRRSLTLVLVFKPLASTCFVLLAVLRDATATPFGRVVLAALLLCWLGDVLLIGRSPRLFLGGLISFLLGHLALCLAFAGLGVDGRAVLVGAAGMTVVSLAVLRWLWSGVPRAMRVPVLAYVTVISVMVSLAAGSAVLLARWDLLAAAVCFFVSDIAVARDRFVREGLLNRLWGLPLYYLAVVLFALSVST